MNANEASSKSSLNVLVVDDGEIELKLMEYFISQIKQWDISCFQAQSAEQAIVILQNTPIDLCLFDYYLAGETGVELAQQLIELGIRKPIVMVTGLDDDELQGLVLDQGIVHTLSKEDLSPESIAKSIQAAIS